jgi:hypothetical protein
MDGDERIEAWFDWIESRQDDQIEAGGEPLDAVELVAAGLAELEASASTLVESEAARRRAAFRIVARALTRARDQAAADHRRLEARNAVLARRLGEAEHALIAAQEAHASALGEIKDALALLTRDLTRERGLRRLDDAKRLRRARPSGQRAAASAARRAVEEALEEAGYG